MSSPGFFSTAMFNYKRGLFRRDAETSFFSGQSFPFPKISSIQAGDLNKYIADFPFNFAVSEAKFREAGKILASIENVSQIIQSAEKVLNNEFDFPGTKKIPLGKQIRWNYDYLSGYEWPQQLAWKHDFFRYPETTDIVNPWFVARLNQLILLGKAYMVTGEQKYAEYYFFLLKNFRDQNPFCTGVNWTDPREISIRLINMVYSLPFFIHAQQIDADFINELRTDILSHAVYIENNLQQEDRGYTYFLNIAALAAAGLVLKNTYFGEKLIRFSYPRSEQIVRKYVSSEGISDIRSLPYHPHFIEVFIILKKCFDSAGIKVSDVFVERYHRMFDALAAMMRDDNSIARIGDSFTKRILPFTTGENLREKFPLSIGVIETGKGTFKEFIPEPNADVLFYSGMDAVQKYLETNTKKYQRISYGYKKSGVYILRNDDIHITIDAADISSGRKKTRGHIDILSFALFYKGHKVIVDPGTYSFYSDPALYERLRSVKSHNTIYIDDEELVETEGSFLKKEDITKPKITEWHSDEYSDLLSVQHYAYTRFPDPVVIKRIFRLQKERNILSIRDELFGGSIHRAFFNYVFDPSVEVIRDDNDRYRLTRPVNADIVISTPEAKIISSVQDAIYCPAYGIKQPAKRIHFSVSAKFPLYITTEIILK